MTCVENVDLIQTRHLKSFSEEVGELAKEIRKVQGIHVEGSHTPEQVNFGIREEIADVAMYLMDIANTFSVNIEDAIREKEEINKSARGNKENVSSSDEAFFIRKYGKLFSYDESRAP